MKRNQPAFTLIELLVVVAIIGILASVVLAALGSARSRATEAKIKSELSSVRAQAEIYYSANSAYTTGNSTATADCTAGNTIFDASDANSVNSLLASSPNAVCNATATQWAVSAPLTSGGNWCVDSNGASRAVALPLTSGAVVCLPN